MTISAVGRLDAQGASATPSVKDDGATQSFLQALNGTAVPITAPAATFTGTAPPFPNWRDLGIMERSLEIMEKAGDCGRQGRPDLA